MKEILLNNISKATYSIFIDGVATAATGTPTVRVLEGDAVVLNSPIVSTPSTGVYTFIIPPSLTSEEKTLTVEWTLIVAGYAMVVSEYYTVVTPYVQWDYVKESATYEEYLECERVARMVIDGYCGQSFGKIEAIYTSEGNDSNSVRLNRRLISVNDVTHISSWYPTVVSSASDDGLLESWDIAANGWIIRTSRSRSRLDVTYSPSHSFRRNITYSIDGVWGWATVPGPVEEAAKILVGNLLCQDHKYRDKYIESLKTSDWNMKFSPLTWDGTGSATADDLLSEYRMFPGIGVI